MVFESNSITGSRLEDIKAAADLIGSMKKEHRSNSSHSSSDANMTINDKTTPAASSSQPVGTAPAKNKGEAPQLQNQHTTSAADVASAINGAINATPIRIINNTTSNSNYNSSSSSKKVFALDGSAYKSTPTSTAANSNKAGDR